MPCLRVAYLTTSYPADAGDASGHFVRAEALAMAAAGHDVHVLAPAPRADAALTVHAVSGAALFQWPGAMARARERPLRLAALGSFLRGAARALDEVRAEHVVAHWLVPCAFPLLRADEVVCHGADVRLLLALPGRLREGIVSRVTTRARSLRFVATALRDALLDGLSASLAAEIRARAIVVPPRVDVAEREHPERSKQRYLVAAGRLVPGKRFSWAIRASHALSTPLVLLGDGPEETRLSALARDLGADVTFAGRISRGRTLGLLANALALVHPSAEEAAPTIVLEARALGIPVVAAPSGDLALWAATDPGLQLAVDEAGLVCLLRTLLAAS